LDPAWHVGAGRVRRRAPGMIRCATMVLTLSEAVRKQVIERFHVNPDRVVAVPLAASSHFRPSPAPADPYFVFVGTLEPRKNIPQMLEAWRAVRREHPVDLVLAGRRRADFPATPPEPGLQILGEVEEARLPGLYSNAVAVLYPSLYEGFGLPVLEAMQCGACVITSKDPAISEVSAGAALHVEGPAAMAEAMRAVLENPALPATHREKSLTRARAFSWEHTARETRIVYQEALAR
jgi:glycosyltransferase involved in cell wall biosynthesis